MLVTHNIWLILGTVQGISSTYHFNTEEQEHHENCAQFHPWKNETLSQIPGKINIQESGEEDLDEEPRIRGVRSVPVDCLWSAFSLWEKCSTTCGTGIQKRRRKVLQPAQTGGRECRGGNEQSRRCQVKSCPVNCVWGLWGGWEDCDRTCGGGTRRRERRVWRDARAGGIECQGDSQQLESCNTNKCHPPQEVCCSTVEVVATGSAAQDQALYMGRYVRLDEEFNGRVVYKQEDGGSFYIYFFHSARLDLWVVGPHLGTKAAGIRNIATDTCVENIGRGWMFASRAGVWQEDKSLNVKCVASSRSEKPSSSRSDKPRKSTQSSPQSTPRHRVSDIQNIFDSGKFEVLDGKQDCSWSAYSPWSECSASCDGGYHTRIRRVERPARGGGASCLGGERERKRCNFRSCRSFLRSTTTTSTTTPSTTTPSTTRTTTKSRTSTATQHKTITTTKPATTTTTKRKTITTTQPIITTTTKSTTTAPKQSVITTTPSAATTITRSTPALRSTTTASTSIPASSKSVTTVNKLNEIPMMPTRKPLSQPSGNTNERKKDSVICYSCGSLFSVDAPDCQQFNKFDKSQQKLCQPDEACLYYAWTINGKSSVIRECFPTTILLGTIDDPIEPAASCSPVSVESNHIQACICTTDLCTGIGDDSVDRAPQAVVTSTRRPPPTTRARPVKPNIDSSRVRCHQCGSLFSSSASNPNCKQFDQTDPLQSNFCQPGEACLWYSWRKSKGNSAVIRECLSRDVLLGTIENPLAVKPQCEPQDVSENNLATVTACLCDTDLCNSYRSPGEEHQKVTAVHTLQAVPDVHTLQSEDKDFRDSLDQQQFNFKPATNLISPGISKNNLLKKSPEEIAIKNIENTVEEIADTIESLEDGRFKRQIAIESAKETVEDIAQTLEVLADQRFKRETTRFTEDEEDLIETLTHLKVFLEQNCLSKTGRCDATKILTFTHQLNSIIEDIKTTEKVSSGLFNTFNVIHEEFKEVAKEAKLAQGSKCPVNYEFIDGGCYMFSKRRVGWIEAKKLCEEEQSQLVSLETEDKKAAILQHIMDKRRRRLEYWLAGNDIDTEEVWEWATLRTPVGTGGWLDQPYRSTEENCLSWTVQRGPLPSEGWRGSRCCKTLKFICQFV